MLKHRVDVKSGRLSATVPKYGFPTGRFVITQEISAVGNILLSHGGISGMHPLGRYVCEKTSGGILAKVCGGYIF